MNYLPYRVPPHWDPFIVDALNEIKRDYGDVCTIKGKSLIKFGRNDDVGTATTGYTIWATGADQANETLAAENVNSIDSISSSSGSDTSLVVLEGHTQSGGDRTFVVQEATLAGQTRVALTTPLNRLTRMYNKSGTNLVGPVYGYENTALTSGKPTDTTKIHITIRAAKNQSEKAATSLSSEDYWIITGVTAGVLEKASAFADVAIEIKRNGFVFRQSDDFACSSSSGSVPIPIKPHIIAPKNSDIRLVGQASAANVGVSGTIFGVLAQVIG